MRPHATLVTRRRLLACAVLIVAVPARASELFIVGNGLGNMSAEDIKEVFLGEVQFAGSLRLLPVDNAGAQADFQARVLKISATRYTASWTKKAFRDGLNAPALKGIVAKGWVSALAHITGGGIPGNLPRVLPSGVKAEIDLASWPVPAIFKYLARLGKIDTDELLQSFNVGVGMILVVPPKFVKSVEADLKKRREKFFRIGRVERAESGKARVSFSGSLNL